MTIEHSQIGDVKLVKLAGSLTQLTIEQVGPAFATATLGEPRVVVDVTGVDLVTTPGIAMLLAADKSARQRGEKMILTGTRGLVDDLLKRCKLDAVLNIAPTRDEAFRRAQS